MDRGLKGRRGALERGGYRRFEVKKTKKKMTRGAMFTDTNAGKTRRK